MAPRVSVGKPARVATTKFAFIRNRHGAMDSKRKLETADRALCMAPWVNLHVRTDGSVTPCCESRQKLGDINRERFTEIWDGPEITTLRAQMLRGELVEGCRKCFEKETAGVKSLRERFNERAKHLSDRAAAPTPGKATALPVYWDIRFSNICNFRCRSCWFESSSRWFADAKALNQKVGDQAIIQGVEDADGLFDQLDSLLPHVEEIYFAGGEPLLMDEHYRLLDRLAERGLFDTPLRYNTNFSETRYKGRDIFDIWARFSNVKVSASVDATGRRGELMRKGQDWAEFLDNCHRIKEKSPNVDLGTDTTVSVFNILHLPELFRELLAQAAVRAERMELHLLQEPEHYNIRILPKAWKARVRSTLEDLELWLADILSGTPDGDTALAYQQNQIGGIVSYMDAEDCSANLPKFRKITQRLDALREEKTGEVFPELAPLLVEEVVAPRRSRFAAFPFSLR
jgi:radical SAM protein with 4Fe4S-binding SPASM domain